MSAEKRLAVVVGASGAIGSALVPALEASRKFDQVLSLSRKTEPPLELTSELSVEQAATFVRAKGRLLLFVDATGFLHSPGMMPEKSWRALDPQHMAYDFAVNAIGPALLMKHFLPLLSEFETAVFVSLSAKLGSIGDNHLGGWYSYRASKAALNQLIRTASIELRRQNPSAVCVALHPGTVFSPLTGPFNKAGLKVRSPEVAAQEIMSVIDNLTATDSGHLMNYLGQRLPW